MKNEIKPNQNIKVPILSYIIGFLSSIALTLSAYVLDMIHLNSYHEVISHSVLIPVLLIIAVAQLIIQLIFFLHLSQENKPRWRLVFFMSTISIVIIVIVGSLWIMSNLNYNMTPRQINQYVQDQEGGF